VFEAQTNEETTVQLEIITIYAVCDDVLQALNVTDDPQTTMTTAEVMTTALVAARFFGGCLEHSRALLKEAAYIPCMLSKSRFNRRLHAIAEGLWQAVLAALAAVHQGHNPEQAYIVDSFPVAVCDNIRIRRCRKYRDEAYRGYCANKKRYVYGLKAHVVVTAQGVPVEVVLAPASYSDGRMGKTLHLDLPEGATVYADAAYTDYGWEDALAETGQIRLHVARKANSKRPHPPYLRYLADRVRKQVETTFSQIAAQLGRRIHAVTPRGFELKVFLFILAFAICG
jgi:transposase